MVLRNIPVSEFREGMAAVYCWNGYECEGWFGRVYLQSSNLRVVAADGARHDLDLVSVVANRQSGWEMAWPQFLMQ